MTTPAPSPRARRSGEPPRFHATVGVFIAVATFYTTLSLVVGLRLPDLLLRAYVPRRSQPERAAILESLRPDGAYFTEHRVTSARGATITMRWLHRPASRGVVILLHGFGDDGFGTAPMLQSFPSWDALVFTFRGRDDHPERFATLGGLERYDVAAAVRLLERHGVERRRTLLMGLSQGAGVALLALADLERHGQPLAGALLESPFEDLATATRDHLRGTLGSWEPVAWPAERIALVRAGAIAGFDPDDVSPARAIGALKTPIAIITGDEDTITPLARVRRVAGRRRALTVVNGAGHVEASAKRPGGLLRWAHEQLVSWNLEPNDASEVPGENTPSAR